ncbi:type II secretion system F family protein [Streptomyces sp. ET3-23]|uniref:type II secretion system F family protein n=1 Tax=Streptomyces sp. ET3-23 TaxID=2885643 RepID=UPI001D0F9DB2|nr:type II secretion system F family protein [Streptomyces sp. ET3-23]MCC2274715.1 type II secretion system F family protein [Streptomyces sp. ET3-23]
MSNEDTIGEAVRGLGPVAPLAVLVLCAAVVIPLAMATVGAAVLVNGVRSRRVVRRRVASLWGTGRRAGAVVRLRVRARQAAAGDGLLAGGAGVVVLVLVGGAAGCLTGAAVAYGVWRWRRRVRRSTGSEVPAEDVARQLPIAADLLAACLAAGAGPREAAEAVGASLGGPVGERLAQAAAEVRLGGDPAAAWGRLGNLPGAGGLARCLERAQATGVPAVEPMSRLAVQLRTARTREAGIRARRAGVLATAPLGLCFLPAFLTVGVVPVVYGLAGGLLKGS